MLNSCSNNNCTDKFSCPDGKQADFVIKRHDTKPPFEIIVKDCDGPIDLTDTVLEVSMWFTAKLKKAITSSDAHFALADNKGFEQAIVGDIIVVDRVRAPEQMLITGFDEDNKFIQVQRGYNGTAIGSYKRGQSIRIFRVLNGVGETQMTLQDIPQVDGTTDEDVLTESRLIYEWQAEDTCVPGCFWFEFKLLKMIKSSPATMTSLFLTGGSPSVTPSFTSQTPEELGCSLGQGVEWSRKFPVEGEGFLVKIIDSPTSESLV